jgi:hypothetical protein
LGLRDGVLHFRHYLLGIKFKVHTDHSSLRWLMTQPEVALNIVIHLLKIWATA